MYNAVGIIPYTAFIMLLPEKKQATNCRNYSMS